MKRNFLAILRATNDEISADQFGHNLGGVFAYSYNGHVYAKYFVEAESFEEALRLCRSVERSRLAVELVNLGDERDRGA